MNCGTVNAVLCDRVILVCVLSVLRSAMLGLWKEKTESAVWQV